VDALDPANPYSLVSLPLGDLPVEIIGLPVLRRLTLVKTLAGQNGLVTEVQQFSEAIGTGIRSIGSTIQEFSVSPGEAAVLMALGRAASFDLASRRLALARLFREDPIRSKLLDDCPALRFDQATRKATEGLTQRYTKALFAHVFNEDSAEIRSIADLVARLDRASSDPDPTQRQRVQTHIVRLQEQFRLPTVADILPFLSEFELFVTAIGHYRQNFLALVPHMQRLEKTIQDLSQPDNQMISRMLDRLSRHLGQTMSSIERFFDAFDSSFDGILATAVPETFKQLQESLQRAYATIGRLLCAWGLRLQALQNSADRQRRPLNHAAQLDIIRELICKQLNDDDLHPRDLQDAIAFLKQAGSVSNRAETLDAALSA
jgi:hypothetical protein